MKIVFFFFTLSLLTQALLFGSFTEHGDSPWGSDSELAHISRKPRSELLLQKQSVGQKSCRSLIRFFQVYISPIDGPRSSFYPTSSQYALEAIQKYGVFAGIAMGCDRLMRENGEFWVYERTNKYGIERKLDPVP